MLQLWWEKLLQTEFWCQEILQMNQLAILKQKYSNEKCQTSVKETDLFLCLFVKITEPSTLQSD